MDAHHYTDKDDIISKHSHYNSSISLQCTSLHTVNITSAADIDDFAVADKDAAGGHGAVRDAALIT